jgi:hypothetical protein
LCVHCPRRREQWVDAAEWSFQQEADVIAVSAYDRCSQDSVIVQLDRQFLALRKGMLANDAKAAARYVHQFRGDAPGPKDQATRSLHGRPGGQPTLAQHGKQYFARKANARRFAPDGLFQEKTERTRVFMVLDWQPFLYIRLQIANNL